MRAEGVGWEWLFLHSAKCCWSVVGARRPRPLSGPPVVPSSPPLRNLSGLNPLGLQYRPLQPVSLAVPLTIALAPSALLQPQASPEEHPRRSAGVQVCPCPIPPGCSRRPDRQGEPRTRGGRARRDREGWGQSGPAPAPPHPGPADSLVCPGQTGGRAGADAVGPERAVRERADGAAAPSVPVGAPWVPDSPPAGPWRAPGPASTRCSWSRPPW